jgi:hypothetical protein
MNTQPIENLTPFGEVKSNSSFRSGGLFTASYVLKSATPLVKKNS